MKFAAWLAMKQRERAWARAQKARVIVDGVTIEGRDGKCLLAMKYLEEGKTPVLEFRITRKDSSASHYMQTRPAEAGRLADWLLDAHSGGWTPEPGPGVPQCTPPAPESLDAIKQRASVGLLLYALNVLRWKLPDGYGPHWMAGELSGAGVPIVWSEEQQRFQPAAQP